MDHTMKFNKWIKHSFQGNDGKASHRKLTTFVVVLMVITTWVCDLFFELTINETLLIGLLIMAMIGQGFMTAQNVVDILKRPQNSYYDNEIYNPYNKSSNSDNLDDIPPVE